MTRERPPLLLRFAVVVGAISLLLGVAGIVFLVLRTDEDASAAGSGPGERVRVVGAAADATLAVDVRWEEGPILHTEAAHPIGGLAGSFLLPPGLVGRPVVVEVRDAGTTPPRRLVRREIVPREGGEIELEVGNAGDG